MVLVQKVEVKVSLSCTFLSLTKRRSPRSTGPFMDLKNWVWIGGQNKRLLLNILKVGGNGDTVHLFIQSAGVLTFWFCACNILKDVEFIISVLVCQSYSTTRYWIIFSFIENHGTFWTNLTSSQRVAQVLLLTFPSLYFVFWFGRVIERKRWILFFPPHWPRNAIRTHHFYYVYVYKYICVLIFSVRRAQWATVRVVNERLAWVWILAVSTSWVCFRVS